MADARIQRSVSFDGVEIAARVHGQGPPLVLVHGAFADGETAWLPLLPELTDHFSCYSMSLRGRGLSGPADDLGPDRLFDDAACLVESIGTPAPIVGLSGGALMSLGAAQRTDAISAVVAYEPPVFQVMDEPMAERFDSVIAAVAELVGAGRPADGVQAFIDVVTNSEELAAVTEVDLAGTFAANAELQLREMAALLEEGPPSATEPDQLARIQAPVLLLHGTRSMPAPWFLDGVHHVARHVPNAHVRAVEGAGHLGPLTHPVTVAGEIEAFLATVHQPA
jgi:pimeloyl-ACP methyl ester carboxylesterase